MQKNWSLKILNSFKKLSELDDDLKYIINKYNLPDSRKESNTFETLMRIIIGQQISRKAAESIYQKLKEKKRSQLLNHKIVTLKLRLILSQTIIKGVIN